MQKINNTRFLRGNPHGEKPRDVICVTQEPQSTNCNGDYNLGWPHQTLYDY